jgi:hypothetical protein
MRKMFADLSLSVVINVELFEVVDSLILHILTMKIAYKQILGNFNHFHQYVFMLIILDGYHNLRINFLTQKHECRICWHTKLSGYQLYFK